LQVVIAEYDPRWPSLYAAEAERVRGVLGERVLRLEHVGSTSVPGLPAKPIIDMLLAVADSSLECAYMPALEGAGYKLHIREPDWFEHRLFKGPGVDINLHVFSAGCAEIDRMLRFRDWLRSHPDDLALYLSTKRALAQQEWGKTQDYADAKTDVIREILGRAR
jgi:GrpB-like predicted nucleotidyltransferase (UPF0157 family)